MKTILNSKTCLNLELVQVLKIDPNDEEIIPNEISNMIIRCGLNYKFEWSNRISQRRY